MKLVMCVCVGRLNNQQQIPTPITYKDFTEILFYANIVNIYIFKNNTMSLELKTLFPLSESANFIGVL